MIAIITLTNQGADQKVNIMNRAYKLSPREIQMVKDADVNLRIKYRTHKAKEDFYKLPRRMRAISLAVQWGMCSTNA